MIVRRIEPEESHDLRLRVLRNGRAGAELVFKGDRDPLTAHFGAFEACSEVGVACEVSETSRAKPLAVARVCHSPLTHEGCLADAALDEAGRPIPREHQWQLRGMASDPSVRGRGFGAAVLRAVIGHVGASAGGASEGSAASLLWCNARLNAIGFYEKHGMRVVSPEFEIEGVGPHVVMVMVVASAQHK